MTSGERRAVGSLALLQAADAAFGPPPEARRGASADVMVARALEALEGMPDDAPRALVVQLRDPALSERIGEHQRHVLSTYCETPAVLGGDPL